MKKTLPAIILFYLVLSGTSGWGQTFYDTYPLRPVQQKDEAFRKEIRHALQISTGMLYEATDSSYKEACEGYDRAIKLRNPELIAFYESILGDLFKTKGNYSEASIYYYRALNYYHNREDTLKTLLLLTSIADLNRSMGEYLTAFRFLNNAGVLCMQRPDDLHSLAVINATRAAVYLEILSLGFRTLFNEYHYRILPEYNIDSLENKAQKRFYRHIRNSYSLASQTGDTLLMIKNLNLLAKYQHFQKNYEPALSHYHLANELIQKSGIITEKALVLSNLSSTYIAQKEWGKALEYAKSAYEEAIARNALYYKWLASINLYEIYKHNGDFKQALFYKEMDTRFLPRLYNEKVRNQMNLTANKFESDMQADQIRKLEKEQAYQAKIDKLTLVIFNIVLLILTVLIFMFFIMWRNARYRKIKTERENAIKAELLEKAEKARKIKDEFMANVSHEIRTPMSAMLGYTELLNQSTTDKQQKDYIKGILVSGKILLELINDLLDLSRLESHKAVLAPRPVNLKTIVFEAEKILHYQLKNNNIIFTKKLVNVDHKVFMLDEVRIKQILLNLIGNAIKYTRDGNITLQIEAMHGQESAVLHFEISDTGMGISKEQLDKVFEPFHQIVPGTQTEGSAGFGLGLAITKNLVHTMNGVISIESEINKGTVISIDLPAVPVVHEKQESLITDPLEPVPATRGITLSTEDKAYITNELLPKWQEIKKMMSKDEIEDFAQTIYLYGDKQNIPQLTQWSEKVQTHAKNFDVRQLFNTFNDFSSIVKSLT